LGRETYNPKLLRWVEDCIEAMKRRVELAKGNLARVLVMAQDWFVMQVHLDGPSNCSDRTIELFCDLILGHDGQRRN
jgi:hypothetical protein